MIFNTDASLSSIVGVQGGVSNNFIQEGSRKIKECQKINVNKNKTKPKLKDILT